MTRKKEVTVGYKFVTDELHSKNGGCQWVIGEWKHAEGKLVICENGLHASETALDSLNYPYGNRWFMVEARSEQVKDSDKFVAREMRLATELPIKEILVKFAILCARRSYKNWKAKYPEDNRVWNAIVAAEKWLKNPTEETAWSAESAACAAWSAARSAESAACAAWSAARSAESAACAAWSAASAARSAEREWHNKTLNRLIKKSLKKVKQK